MNKSVILLFLTYIITCKTSENEQTTNARTFVIDWNNNQFLKDGEPFRYISGSIHYFRHPRAYWGDRLRALRAAGFNAVCVYIEWSLHESTQGEYDFTGEKDITHFINLAQAEGLLVILRPGPYICAERDFGGYPSWLLTENPDMILRTNDTRHTKYVYQWLTQLFPVIQPLLYGNGGPIIMVQVENEYGFYSMPDSNYTLWLRDVFRKYVGSKAVLFTTDGWHAYSLVNGPIPGVFTTVDFGTGFDMAEVFQPLRDIQPTGPLVNSEFYPGWLTHWGEIQQVVPTEKVITSLRDILDYKASVNMYMFAGGTNFGFTSGANYYETLPYQPDITSYDYDAPIDESGDPTEKYYAIRQLLSEYVTMPDVPVPQPTPKGDYGTVKLHGKVSLFDAPTPLSPVKSTYPMSFEALGQSYGFILYEATVPKTIGDPAILFVENLHDRATVYLDKDFAGVLSRTKRINTTALLARPGQTLSLLVENQGRINFRNFKDFKGILSNVTISNTVIEDWLHTGYPLSDISEIEKLPKPHHKVHPPAFYTGHFQLPENMTTPLDTYVNMDGWGKGVLFVNQYNLGRYWPTTGPQITLYVPGCYLRPYPSHNRITIFEIEHEHPKATVKFVTEPILNGTCIQ